MSQAILGVLRGSPDEEDNEDMGDLNFLSIKEFDSKRVDVNDILTLNNTHSGKLILWEEETDATPQMPLHKYHQFRELLSL